MEILKNDETAALMWFNPVKDGVVECHACAHPAWRGRWLSRDTVATIAAGVYEATGRPKAFMASVPDKTIERIWRRLGFTIIGGIAVLTTDGE